MMMMQCWTSTLYFRRIMINADIIMVLMKIVFTITMFIISSISLDFHGRLEAESQAGATRRMKQEACRYLIIMIVTRMWMKELMRMKMTMNLEWSHMMNRGHLHAWFQDNKIIWVTVLASIAAIQVSSS